MNAPPADSPRAPSTSAYTAAQIAGATLAALPGINWRRLRRLVAHFGDPCAALEAVLHGHAWRALWGDEERTTHLARAWRRAADPDLVARRLAERGTHVWLEGAPDDPFTRPVEDQPCVLFGEGADPDVFSRPRVAIIGTRGATPHGLADAAELAEFLAAHGVTVVSGLAIGIDGAAHEGALRGHGAVAGVVATGLDVEYPRRHKVLYRRVREHGVVVSEHWYGVRPDPARFPVRNRIIAALCDVLVIVEATPKGGTRSTAEAALRHGRPILALPGSRRNPAAAGCNELLRDGAGVLHEPGDMLVALELAFGGRATWRPPPARPHSRTETRVMQVLGGEPATVDDVIVRSGLSSADVVTAVRDLEQRGALLRRRGFLWPC
jgi:DNA processing protein